MYSLPNQKTKSFLETLDRIIKLSPEHISAYCLKIEENTPFGKIKSTLALPDEDEEYNTYISMCESLLRNGYKQYEISNFSKEGYECKHNLKYWQSEEYIGIGPSAHSFFNGERYFYSSNLAEYISKIQSNEMPSKIFEKDDEALVEMSKIDEYVMLKMRLCGGVSLKEFYSLFQKDFIKSYPKINAYLKTGHVIFENDAYKFTSKGFFVSNYILSDILNI
jgi:oxygen-independent coproporphyrinogen-3 oxidase